MLLTFPDLDTLRLAITSGTIPDGVSRTALRAEFADDGRVVVQTESVLPRPAETALKRLRVQIRQSKGDPLPEQFLCWTQLLPLTVDGATPAVDRRPVLFELSDPEQLSEIVSEMLRLGNDRQAWRWISDGRQTRTLLRVVEPPYYTLLRALDRSRGPAAPRAYLEQGERVWVEIGSSHPLAGRLKLPVGKMLLMRPERDWELLDEGRFQDVYSLLELAVDDEFSLWQPAERTDRIRVPLRLAASDSTDPAELWVVSSAALEQLDELVQNADDQLLSRLAFAVGKHGEQTSVVLRSRPGKAGPPVLVLDATAYRPYLKLPNLFVPCTARLHPPLRRDAVKSLLADDLQQIVWLAPGERGAFTPHSLPDAAFRPMTDWVDYVLDRDRQALSVWMESMQFDFEPFVCREAVRDDGPRPDKSAPLPEEELVDESPPEIPDPEPIARRAKRAPKRRQEEPEDFFPKVKPNELRVKLQAVEQEFQKLKSPLDAGPEHQELWVRMTQLNAALDRHGDAQACAGNALWNAPAAPPASFWVWSRTDAQKRPDAEWTPHRLDQVLTEPNPSLADVNGLVALLAWSLFAGTEQAARGIGKGSGVVSRESVIPTEDVLAKRLPTPVRLPAVADRLGAVQQFLEKHESLIGVRLAWLAWLAVFHQSQHDVLTLARARDRILERLFHNGLGPDLDVPSFLRYTGSALTDRLRVARDHVINVRKVVGEWYRAHHTLSAPETEAYIDLMFAFALARLGETTECQRLQKRADEALVKKDLVHTWLAMAFIHRIQQALEGKAGGQLPDELMTRLNTLDRTPRYVIDRLRERSRILEPHEKFDPYRNWKQLPGISRELATLCDVLDRGRLAQRLNVLFQTPGLAVADEVRVLTTALDLAPRLGEATAASLLDRVPKLLPRVVSPLDQMQLLEKGLFVAAHFDHPAHVQNFVARFRRLIEGDLGAEVEKGLEAVLQRSFLGLRKLGMRDEISRLLEQMAERVRRMSPRTERTGAPDDSRVVQLRLLLQIATGWFYFGQDDRARPILDEARTTLFDGNLIPTFQTDLACAYLAALGQAPVEVAIGRMTELFRHLDRIRDGYTTNTHYSRSQLAVVESTVFALISDDVTIDKAGRRWLDDDEYLVRKKIHADVRAAMP